MSRIVHFEMPADNPDRAMAFYAKAFGWEFNKFEGPMDYWLVSTGKDDAPGINGGLAPRREPGQPPVNVIGVESVDDAAGRVEDAGGTVVVPKMPIPGVGYVAYFTDTEGNTVGIYEDDNSAG